jgi:ferric-dicitrate binding protein FerR (iron transport regulator)
VVERVVHAAWAEHGSPVVLHAGREVGAGSTVRTSADGRAALRAPTGHGLRLDHDTSLRVLSDRGFLLERGAVYVDSGPPRVPAPPPIRIATARAAIDEVGTQFEARLAEGALTVRVREGQVQVGAGSASLRAFAGQSVTVDRSGRLTRAGALPDGGWEWTEHVAPPFPIEGRSLADFLTWAARERGARVRYLDRSLAERAPGIVLHGSVEGMTLDQAVASVTTTSGLVHRWEGKELVVREAP